MALDKFRLAASAILRKNIVIVFVLGLFPLAGFRVQNRTLVHYRSWSFRLGTAVLLPGLYVATLSIIQLLQDAADARRERAGDVVFSGAIGWRLLFLVAVIFPVIIDVGLYHQEGRLTTEGLGLTIVMGLLAFYCWPRTIAFSSGALVQRTVFGGMKSILFSDIMATRFDAQQQCILISGKNGARIVHSMFHAGRKQFARQLKLLTGADVPGLRA